MITKAFPFLLCMALVLTACKKSDLAAEALDKAGKFAAHGKYQEALQQHLWFHQHALEVNEGYYGARLSVALTAWVELGGKYPPARQALVQIRDGLRDQLRAGGTNYQSFHEVVAISKELGEPGVAVELFKQTDAAQPAFAAEVYGLIEESLAAAGEFALARKYLGPAAQRLAKARDSYEYGLKFAAEQANPAGRKAFEAIFAEDVVRIITILERTGAGEEARAVQAEALKILAVPAIRDALKK